jgi:hypothetical protein
LFSFTHGLIVLFYACGICSLVLSARLHYTMLTVVPMFCFASFCLVTIYLD